jgi:plastocyanin
LQFSHNGQCEEAFDMARIIRPRLTAVFVPLLAGFMVASCKGGNSYPSTPTTPSDPSPAPANPAPANAVTVNIVGSSGSQAYQPNPVSVGSGSSVVFKNTDAQLHHIVMDDGADLGSVGPGSTSSAYTVKNANQLGYHCLVHPSMVGKINAAAAPEPEPTPTPVPTPTPTPTPDPYGDLPAAARATR